MKPLLFAVCATALQTAKSPLHIRGLMSCEETYGEGSQQCGPPESGFCYTPSEGQTCCDNDHGYCPSGTYCAPAPGQCCLEGETLQECASAGSFDLPSSAAATATATPPSDPTLYSGNDTDTRPARTACSSVPTGTACVGEVGSGPILTSRGTRVLAGTGAGLCTLMSLALL